MSELTAAAGKRPATESRTFWRIIKTIPATESDFQSYRALGIQLLNPEDPETEALWEGISVYSTEQQARNAARMALFRSYAGLARLFIPLDGSIRVERTGRHARGHHTLWGSSQRLLECVRDYVPLSWRTP